MICRSDLKKSTYQGDACYTWVDVNDRMWRVYKSFGLWRYIREDHNISSVGHPTLNDAIRALGEAFEDRPTPGTCPFCAHPAHPRACAELRARLMDTNTGLDTASLIESLDDARELIELLTAA